MSMKYGGATVIVIQEVKFLVTDQGIVALSEIHSVIPVGVTESCCICTNKGNYICPTDNYASIKLVLEMEAAKEERK